MGIQNNINKIMKDIDEGIIVVDNTGTISEINSKAMDILNITEDYSDKKYLSLIDDDKNGNDEFHQMIVDAVVDKKTVHKKRVKYKTGSEEKTLFIASSMVTDDEGNKIGAVLPLKIWALRLKAARNIL